jgi:tetratricopeptide (TPR) repeat protein
MSRAGACRKLSAICYDNAEIRFAARNGLTSKSHIFRATTVALLLGTASAAYAAPSPTQTLVDQAAIALTRGDATQAATGYTEALKDTTLPNDRRASILTDRGVAYTRLNQAKLAIDDFNKAAQLFPEYAAVYNNRGNLLLALGLPKEAIKDFERALVLAPGYASAYNNRANAYMKLGQAGDAIRDYSKAIQLMPTNAAPLSGRGRAHLASGRPHAAIRDFSRSVTADSRFASGYRNRAEAKLEVEHFDEAIEDLSRAIAFDAENVEMLILRGNAYMATKNMPSAIKDFTRAIEINPNSNAAFEARGLAHALIDAREEAFADLNRAIELDPRSATAFAYRAFVYKQDTQPDVAMKDIETALKLDDKRAEIYWARAEIEESQGMSDQAVADLRRALGLRPGYRDALDSLQRLGFSVAEPDDAGLDGLGLDKWRVITRAGRYVAVNEDYPRISVPLEMMGDGKPRITDWELKEAPFKGIGILTFDAGSVTTSKGKEETEQVAIIDTQDSKIVAIEPHKQGAKTANWTWEEGKVTIASADGVTDEYNLRVGKDEPRRAASTQTWTRPQRRKPKTLFDLFFN